MSNRLPGFAFSALLVEVLDKILAQHEHNNDSERDPSAAITLRDAHAQMAARNTSNEDVRKYGVTKWLELCIELHNAIKVYEDYDDSHHEEVLLITALAHNAKDNFTIHPDVEEAFQQVDAAMFTGDPTESVTMFERLRYFIGRWDRAIKSAESGMHKSYKEDRAKRKVKAARKLRDDQAYSEDARP